MSLLNGGGWPQVIGQLGQAYFNYRAASSSGVQPGGGMIQTMGALPPLARLGGAAIGTAVGVGVRSAAAAMRGAIAWCRRNPAWCANAGGTAAIAAMIQSGQLPMPKHRRARGLSGRDIRGFRRTVRLMRATAGAVGLRRAGGRGRPGTSSTMITQN